MMHTVFLILHIASGFTALAIGTVIGFRRKADASHARLGMLYVYAMIGVGVTALVLSVINPSTFLFIIACFSLYMAWTGKLAINGKPPSMIFAGSLLIVGVALIVLFVLGKGQMGFVGLVFGLLISAMALNEMRLARAMRGATPTRAQKWQRHITLMGGALISTWTAFLVVNTSGLVAVPGIVVWVGPSIIGTVMIAMASRKYVPNRKTSR